ncbi:MAG: MFS transporter [Alphaproteobacteria bacterium]
MLENTTIRAAAPTGAARPSVTVLVALFAIYLFSSVDRWVFGILAQPIKVDLVLSDAELGFLNGFAFNAVLLAAGFPMARLTDKGSRVTILSVCVGFWSLMTGLSGVCVNFIQLSLARMGVGVGEAACLPASHSLITDYFPPNERTKALAFYGLGYPLGAVLGSAIGGVVADHWGWRAAFYVLGVPGIALALLARVIIKEPKRGQFDVGVDDDPLLAQPISFREVWLLMWRSPALRHMTIAMALATFFTVPTSSFLGAYLVRKFALSYTDTGLVVGMTMMFGATISTIVGGGYIAQWLAKRNERWLLWFPAITVGISTPLFVIALAQTNWFGLSIWMFLAALAHATYLAPCYTVLHNAMPPGGRAKAVVIVQAIMGLVGFSISPLLAGAGMDLIAAGLFGDYAPQGFAAACPGGQAITGAAAALDATCRKAVVDATQIVMIGTSALIIWPAWHFFLAGRGLKQPAR